MKFIMNYEYNHLHTKYKEYVLKTTCNLENTFLVHVTSLMKVTIYTNREKGELVLQTLSWYKMQLELKGINIVHDSFIFPICFYFNDLF